MASTSKHCLHQFWYSGLVSDANVWPRCHTTGTRLPNWYENSHTIQPRITVLPATQHRWHSRFYPIRSCYSIKWPQRDARLSWLSWLITYRDSIPARKRSPIQVLKITNRTRRTLNFVHATNSANHYTTPLLMFHISLKVLIWLSISE